MVTNLELKNYLLSLTATDTGCGKFYTQTDVIELTVQTEREREARKIPEQKKPESFPVLTGIRKYVFDPKVRHVLLSGRPGSGKSMSLRRLLLEEAERSLLLLEEVERSLQGSGIIPVLVELRSRQPILKLIESAFRQHRLRLSAEQIDDLLFEGKLLLLLDGVNEIPTDELLTELEEFRGNNLATPMIFTTRDLGMGGDLRIEKKMQMEPLKPEQMRQFVGKYLPGDPGAELLRQLGDRLKELGETPLLLKLLCDVFKLRQEIPKNKGELFQWVDEEYDRLKGMPTLVPELRHWKAELLQQLAFEMMQGNDLTKLDLTILRTGAIAIFEVFLREHGVEDCGTKARVWLEDLQKYHLLQPTAAQKIEFHHQLFQEYYAAEYLLRRLSSLNDAVLRREYLNYLKWREPLALMLGLVGDEGQALRVVELALDMDLMMGARLAGEVKREFQRESIELIEDLEGVHYQLKIELMGETRSEVAIAFLTIALMDECSSFRRSAAEALGNLGNKLVIPALQQALGDQDYSVLRSTADALIKLGSQAEIPTHRKFYQEQGITIDVRLEQITLYSPKELSGETVLTTVLQDLQSEDYFVRWKAVDGLAQLWEKLGYESVYSALRKALLDENPSVRQRAVEALGEADRKTAILELLQVLQHKNSDSRSNAAVALGKLGSAEAIPGLLQALQDEFAHVRGSAASALGQLNAKETLIALWQGYRATGSVEMGRAIASIQERCQYYNYELEEERKAIATQTDGEGRSVEQPIPNKYYITAEVAQIIEGNKGNIIGKRDHKAE